MESENRTQSIPNVTYRIASDVAGLIFLVLLDDTDFTNFNVLES
jgi:hypothetical protein